MIKIDRYDDDQVVSENIRQIMVMRGDESRQKFPVAIMGISPQSILIPRYLTTDAKMEVYAVEEYWEKVFYSEDDAQLFLKQENLELVGEDDDGHTIIAIDNDSNLIFHKYHYHKPLAKRSLVGSICPAEVRGVDASNIL